MERARARCPSLPAPQKLTAGREAALRRAWKELGEDMTAWDAFLSRVEASDFLTGRKKDWRATFDWILKPANFAKIQEGNYDNRKGAVQGGAGEGKHRETFSQDARILGGGQPADEEEAGTPWIQQLREWEEHKRTSPRPWDIQPDAGGDRDAPGGDHPDRGRAG